jgi:hypothetical protein
MRQITPHEPRQPTKDKAKDKKTECRRRSNAEFCVQDLCGFKMVQLTRTIRKNMQTSPGQGSRHKVRRIILQQAGNKTALSFVRQTASRLHAKSTHGP